MIYGCQVKMAVTGVLLVSYFCVLVFMNNSSCLKICWPDVYKSFVDGDFDQFENSSTKDQDILDCKLLGRLTAWEMLSKGLFAVERRKILRHSRISTGNQCLLSKYVVAMIILLSGDISLNPGPRMFQNIQNEDGSHHSLGMDKLLRCRGIKVFHQNIRGLISHKDTLVEFLSRFENDQIHIFGVSETHLSKVSNLDGEIEIPGYKLQRKDRLTGEGGGVAVFIKDTLCWHRRHDLETDDIECIWIELSINKFRPILLGNIYRPPDTSLYLPRDFNDKFETMLEKINAEEKETLLLGDMNCDFLTRRQIIY